MNEHELRERMVLQGRSLFERGYTCGSSGNISVRLADGVLVTPTNSCLGRLDPARISRLTWNGELLAGDPPSKEAFLHLSVYRARPDDSAIVHLHSTYSVAVSCLADIDTHDVLPPLTAYYVMRVGRLPLVPYFRPGDRALAEAVRAEAKNHRAVLLANHGPVVAGKSLDDAVDSAEELEATAKLVLLLDGKRTHPLDAGKIAELEAAFPS